MELPDPETSQFGLILVVLMRLESKVNYVISMLEDGETED
jgi:hypothetical protein